MNAPALALGAAALTGVLAAVVARFALVRLPEPVATPEQPADDKIAYASLATPRFIVGCGLVGGLAALASWLALPLSKQPAWSVLAVLGVILAAIDLRTTWLPKILTWVSWCAMAAALVTSVLAGDEFGELVRATLGAIFAGAMFGVLWLVSRGNLGFGDVRFAPLIGAAAAQVSWNLLLWSLLLGSLAGAVHGVVRLVVGRRGAYPYAPAMLAGAYLALGAAVLGLA